jgi:hypothetical protein
MAIPPLFVQYETRLQMVIAAFSLLTDFVLPLADNTQLPVVRAIAGRCGLDRYPLTIKLELKPVRGSAWLCYAGRWNGSLNTSLRSLSLQILHVSVWTSILLLISSILSFARLTISFDFASVIPAARLSAVNLK